MKVALINRVDGRATHRLFLAVLWMVLLAAAVGGTARAQDLKYTVPAKAMVKVGDADLMSLQETEIAVLVARVGYHRVLPGEAEAKAELKQAKKALKGLKANKKAAVAEVDAARANDDKERLERARAQLEREERAYAAGEARIKLAEDQLDLARARIEAASAKLDVAAAARELARVRLVQAAGGEWAESYDLEKFVAQLNAREKVLAEAVDLREELEARVVESRAALAGLTN